jgi:sialidase-1
MFIEAAVNDRVNGTDSLTQVRDLEGIVRHARRANPEIDMILMELADPYKNADYDKGIIPTEISNHELVAGHYGLPSINLAKEVHDKMANHEFSWEKDFQDLHPALFGQQLYFNSIKSLLEDCLTQYHPLKRVARNNTMPKMLDPYSFINGKYLDVDQAKYNSGWTLVKDWVPSDQADTRPGFVHVPVLQNSQTDAELTLSFQGNAIGIAIVSGPDAGVISYSIDQGPYLQKDLFTEWSNELHLPWYLLLGSGLTPGEHTLHLKVLSQKNDQSKGNVCRIVYFLCDTILNSSAK